MASTLNASLAVDAVLDYNVHRFQPKQFYTHNAKSITSLNNVHRSQPHRHSHSYSHLSLHNSAHNSLPQNLVQNTFQPTKQQASHHHPHHYNNHQQQQQQQQQQHQQRIKQLSQRASSAKDLNELPHGTTKTAQVVLLDGQKLYFPVQTRLFAGDLFDMVAKHYNLKEKEFFGLAFINETGTFSWLNLDKRVVEHEFPNTKTPTNQDNSTPKNDDKSVENDSKPFEETQTLNRSSTRRIGELKRKNQALKSKKVTSSLINLNSVQNKLKQKFNSSGMLGKSTQNIPLSNGIGDVSVTAPNSQCNSRHSSIASVNELELDPIYHEVPFDKNSQQRSLSFSNGLESSHTFANDDDVEQSADIVLYFMVKYFVESIRLLTDNVTIQLFYLQAKSLLINEYIQVSPAIAPELGALILQITYGDTANFSLERTQSRIQKWRLISNQVDTTERSQIEKKIIDAYGRLEKTTRGECIFRFMTLIEKEQTYGVHYFEALENKTRQLVWLGFSNKGILQFDYSDRLLPVKQFSWKHLENLYFRERKFSIEVRDAKRVVLALSSINLYENAIEEIDHLDDLSSAICDPTTQVSVSRRTFGPSNVTVYVWFATNCQLTKCMWSMAVAQHQFYTERHSQKCNPPTLRTEEDIIRALDSDKFLFVGSRSNWSKRKSLSSKSSSHRPTHHPSNHYSSMCSVSSSRASSISGSLSNLSDSSSSSLSSEVQTFGTDITRMSRTFKCSDRSRNLISRKLKLLEMQLNEKLQEIDKLDRLENQLLRKAKSQTNLHQSRPRLQDYLEVVSSTSFAQHPHNRASISSTSSSGTSGVSAGLQMMHSSNMNNINNLPTNGRPLKSSNSITSTNSLRNFVVTGRSSVAGSTVSNNSAENVPPFPVANTLATTKKLPPLPNQGNELKKSQALPLPPLPPSASNVPQFIHNQPQMRNSTSSERPFSKEHSVKNLPTFTSPYVDRFEKFVHEDGFNLYSVPNRRTSIAMNSFDDFFIKNGAPKFQSTTSLDTGSSFPNGITSVKSSNFTTDSNSVIYETVTYSSSGSNPGSRIGSRSNLSSQMSHSNFSPALVESSVDDECDSIASVQNKEDYIRASFSSGKVSELDNADAVDGKMKHNGAIQSHLGRTFFQDQNQGGAFDQQNFLHYRSAFVNKAPQNARKQNEFIGYSSRPTNPSLGDCQIPIINQVPQSQKPETAQFKVPKTYPGTLSQHQPKAAKGWVETDLDSSTGIVHIEAPKEEKPVQTAVQTRPLIVQSQKVATFMPQSMALKHVTHESDSLGEPIESSVDDVQTEDATENHYQEIVSNIPTPSPSPPNAVGQGSSKAPSPVELPLSPPPVPKHSDQFIPICEVETVLQPVPLVSSQIQNNVPSYITNSEPRSAGTKLSQVYHSAPLSQSQNTNPPVQYHAAPVIVERTPPPPLQSRPIIPSSSVATSLSGSPTPSSVPSPVHHKRNSAALLSPTESVMSHMSSNGPLSPLCTVAFVPANANTEPTNTIANGTFQSNIGSAIPVASCKGNIVEVDVVTVGQYQPGYEEEKPFTMDDFFKYSQKYRNSKPAEEKVEQKLANQVGQLNIHQQQQ